MTNQGIVGGDFAKKVIARLQDVAKDRGQRFAEQWGTPLNGQQLSRQQAAELWNYQNPQTDPLVVQQLVAAGQHSQALDYTFPYRNALIGKGDIKSRVERAQQLADQASQASTEAVGGP
jgi:hypothetical protein